ncbi:MAG: hypothetical protein WC542_05260 [Paludibacter sp.]
MRKLNFHPSFLQILYLIFFLILFAVIIYIPTLIKGPLHITEKFIIEEETLEGSLVAILFILSILIFNLYKREVSLHKELINKINKDKKYVENRLQESDHYIGILNVQIQEINSIFNSISEYPATKADLKKTYVFFAERILGIVNSDWVLIRIINSNTQRTISEHFEQRYGFTSNYPHVSNKMIVEDQQIISCTSIISNPKNINIIVSCVLPVDEISKDQRIFIQAIINEITKLFVILKSTYYIKENNIFVEERN